MWVSNKIEPIPTKSFICVADLKNTKYYTETVVNNISMFDYDTIRTFQKDNKMKFPFMKEHAKYTEPGYCKGIRFFGGLFLPCGCVIQEEDDFCKTCGKKEENRGALERRMNTPLGSYDKKEIGYATYIAKDIRKNTKSMVEIEESVHKELQRFSEITHISAECIDKYHKTIDWDRINLSGRRGRPKKQRVIIDVVEELEPETDWMAQITTDNEEKEEKKQSENEDEMEEVEGVESFTHTDGHTYYFEEESGYIYDLDRDRVGTWDATRQNIKWEVL